MTYVDGRPCPPPACGSDQTTGMGTTRPAGRFNRRPDPTDQYPEPPEATIGRIDKEEYKVDPAVDLETVGTGMV
jgi:hypothetical protein